jgi:predicted secreted protein
MFDFDFLLVLFRFEGKVVKLKNLCYSPQKQGWRSDLEMERNWIGVEE